MFIIILFGIACLGRLLYGLGKEEGFKSKKKNTEDNPYGSLATLEANIQTVKDIISKLESQIPNNLEKNKKEMEALEKELERLNQIKNKYT